MATTMRYEIWVSPGNKLNGHWRFVDKSENKDVAVIRALARKEECVVVEAWNAGTNTYHSEVWNKENLKEFV